MNYKHLKSYLGGGLAVVAAVFVFPACSHHNERLQALEQNYLQAKNDPEISENAPVALYETNNAISKASHADDESEMNHWIYIAEKRLEIAREESHRKEAEATAKNLNENRTDILLSAREKEARDAKNRAENAELERDAAKQTASQLEGETSRLREENALLDYHRAQIERELAELKAKETARGLEITLEETLFEFGKAELKPGSKRKLDSLAMIMKKNPEKEVIIEGHTDSVGSDAYNLNLSQQRAQAVKQYLSEQGLPGDKIVAKGYGEAYPVASNKTNEGRQSNRRVQVIILPEGKTSEAAVRK